MVRYNTLYKGPGQMYETQLNTQEKALVGAHLVSEGEDALSLGGGAGGGGDGLAGTGAGG